jgi:5-methylcytosine-specific restriction endonuclease McrA
MPRNRIRRPRKKERRAAIWEAQQGKCFTCYRDVPFKCATLEHVQPRAKGGDDSDQNFVVTCVWCNESRGTRTIAAFTKYVKQLAEANVLPAPCTRRLPDQRRFLAQRMRAAKQIGELPNREGSR